MGKESGTVLAFVHGMEPFIEGKDETAKEHTMGYRSWASLSSSFFETAHR